MSNKRKKRRRMSGHEQANKGNNPTKTVQTDGPEAQLSVAQRDEANAAPQDHRLVSILALIVSAIAAMYASKQADIAQTALVLGQRAFA
jgi:hypothetical protein